MLNHIRAAALMAVLAVTSGTAAEAATLGLVPTNDPLLTASDVSIDFSSAFGGFYYVAGNIIAATANGAPLTPAPADFVIEGPSLDDLLLDVYAGGGVDAVLSGKVTAVGYGNDVIELLFATLNDASGLFGPRILVLLTAGATAFPDYPLTSDFYVEDASAAITAPVPLPGGMPLLLAALAALQLARGRARA